MHLLLHPLQTCREAWAVALAELAAAAWPGNPLAVAAVEAEKKPAKKAALEGLLGTGAFKAALVAPFVEAVVAGPSKKVCVCVCVCTIGWGAARQWWVVETGAARG